MPNSWQPNYISQITSPIQEETSKTWPRSRVPIFSTSEWGLRWFMALVHKGQLEKRVWRKRLGQSDQIPANVCKLRDGKEYHAHTNSRVTSAAPDTLPAQNKEWKRLWSVSRGSKWSRARDGLKNQWGQIRSGHCITYERDGKLK